MCIPRFPTADQLLLLGGGLVAVGIGGRESIRRVGGESERLDRLFGVALALGVVVLFGAVVEGTGPVCSPFRG